MSARGVPEAVQLEPDRRPSEPEREFDRQVESLLERRYPSLAGFGEREFLAHVSALRTRLAKLPRDGAGQRTAFAIVITSALVPRAEAIAAAELDGRRGFTTMESEDLERFAPLEAVELPDGAAYLVADVDTGRDTLNVTPDDALERIVADGRSPFTIDEGLALVTHFPQLLVDANCFSLLGSRCGDRRVTALWLSEKRPRLGWCWAGNPHTWLGSASCGARIGL